MSDRFGPKPCHCQCCDFLGTFSEAVAHHNETGHPILSHSGVLQDLSNYTPAHIDANRQMMSRENWKRGR